MSKLFRKKRLGQDYASMVKLSYREATDPEIEGKLILMQGIQNILHVGIILVQESQESAGFFQRFFCQPDVDKV